MVMTFYLFIIGFVSILGQVVILRELNVAFYGVELIYVLSMGVWLFWTGLGALIGRRTYLPSVTAVRVIFLAIGILLPAGIAFIRAIRVLFEGIPGAYLPFGQQLIAIFITLFPIGIALGLIFQWAAKLYVKKEKTLAMAYAIESVGGVIGGLTSTLLLQLGVQNFAIGILCSLITVGILLLPGKGRRSFVQTVAVLLAAIFCLLLWDSQRSDQGMTGWTHPNLIDTRDSPYSRITIEKSGRQLIIFENDALGFETESTASEEFVHIVAIQHDHPERVLISGGGVEGIIKEILKHAPRTVDYVELNPVLLGLAEKHLPLSYQECIQSEVVTVHRADPRTFMKDAGAYDLIFIGMPEPTSGQSNRFYTREYFRQCADKLRPGGVLALRLRSSENLWTKFLSHRNASIYHSLKSEFHDVLVLPGVTNTLVASNARLCRDPEVLIKRFKHRDIKARLITPAFIRYIYTNDRFFEIIDRLSSTTALPNTDIRPACYRYSMMIWLSKFIPEMINPDISLLMDSRRISFILYACFGVIIFGLFLLARRSERLKRIILVALAGFLGMAMETLLILYYQVKSGVLFQNIGILLMLFMVGLTAGSIAILQRAKIDQMKYSTIRRQTARLLLIGFGLLSLAFIGLSRSGYPAGIFTVGFLMFIGGFLVAGMFAFCSLSHVKDQKLIVSPLYAADLLGGCVGSLVGSLIFIPFLGMEQSAILMILVPLAALLIV